MTGLVWFRSDLRLHDNEAVTAAVRLHGPRVLGVVCLPANAGACDELGIPTLGAHRAQWWLESIADLRRAFHERGSALVVRVGAPREVLPAVVREYGVGAVYTAPWPAPDEARENRQVSAALAGAGVPLRVLRESTLLHVDDLPMPVERLPDVFTAWRKEVERRWRVRPPAAPPATLDVGPDVRARAEQEGTPGLAELGLEAPVRDARDAMPTPGGTASGRRRMQQWIWETDALATYKETRNGLIGDQFSSRLAPWLAVGSLSAREVQAEVVRYERERVRNESTGWLTFELLWREYFHLWTERWGALAFAPTGIQGRTRTGRPDRRLFEAWCEGRTGEPFVDAGMRELRATGWLSNRLRQNVASWMAKTAELPWTWGARWFESQLIDYDVCSNWGNWQYVAGVGNDPRDRRFDARRQAGMYDADGAYRRLWGVSDT